MLSDKAVSDHYVHGDLLNAIQSSIAKLGRTFYRIKWLVKQ